MNFARIGRMSALVTFALLNMGASVALAADYYAAPTGSSAGNGTIANPWDLATALNQTTIIQPGDTLWLRGGTYYGTFKSNLQGTASAPVIVRQMSGERATLDGGNSGGVCVFTVSGAYTWYWGFEVMSSDPTRVSSQPTSWPTDIPRGEGVAIDQSTPHPGLKFINMVIHDARQGVSFWKEAQDGELYGNLIYNNGWDAPDRGHGHGIYSQNETGTMHLRNNIVFRNFSHGMQVYGSSTSYLDNYDVDGDIWFNNGETSIFGFDRNVLLGGASIANNLSFTNNNFYTCKLKVGYTAPANDVTLTNNYFPVSVEFDATNATMSGNTFLASNIDFSSTSYPGNTYLTSAPTGLRVVVRPNVYEPGRANTVVYNWPKTSVVPVDLSSVLKAGDTFEIRDVQNYFGSPVLSGTYTGSPVNLAMSTFTAIAQAIGNVKLTVAHTSPEFGAFVVLRTGQSTTTNQPPVVNAGPNVTITLPATAQLNGTVTDDGIPGPLTITWAKVSGPGTVTFSNPAAASTSASFSAAGVYTLSLSGFDGALTTTANVTVTVNPPATVISTVQSSSITPTGATSSWSTSTPTNSQVEYGTTASYMAARLR